MLFIFHKNLNCKNYSYSVDVIVWLMSEHTSFYAGCYRSSMFYIRKTSQTSFLFWELWQNKGWKFSLHEGKSKENTTKVFLMFSYIWSQMSFQNASHAYSRLIHSYFCLSISSTLFISTIFINRNLHS